MIRRAYNDPRLILLILLLIVISGVAGFVTRARLEDPESSVRFGYVTTQMPGATPDEIQSRISIPIEEALDDVNALSSIESNSLHGVSIVSIRVADNALDVEQAWSAIRDRLAEVSDELPDRAGTPMLVNDRRWGSYSTVVALIDQSEHGVGPAVLARWGKEVEDRLRFVSGTRFTELFGLPEEEVLVEIDEENLAATGLTIAEVASQVQQRDADVPDASAETSAHQVPVRLMGDVDDLSRLREVVLRRNESGSQLRLGEIATVSRGEREPPRSLAIVNGRRAVVVAIRMEDGSSINRWTASQKDTLDEIKQELPAGLKLRELFSQKRYTDLRSQRLYGSLGLGVLMVMVIVWLMMGWRASIPICAALPLTILGVLFLMMPFDIDLHQMSITGLILALGILIDNPIIVVDNIQRRVESGATPQDSLVSAVKHVARPLVASNVTTILAFAPILMIPGPTGEFLGQLGWTVIASLFVSLILSLTMIPILAAWCMQSCQPRSGGASISNGYANFLTLAFRHPVLIFTISVILPILGFVVAGDLGKQFFPPAERDHFHFSVRLPSHCSILQTQRVAMQARDILLRHEEVEDVSLFVGSNAPKVHYSLITSDENRPNFAQGFVQLKSNRVDPLLVQRIQAELDEALTNAQSIVSLIEQGPPAPSPIEFRIYGPSQEKLEQYGEQARRILMSIPEVIHTRSSLDPGGTQLGIDVKQHEAHAANLNDKIIAEQIFNQLEGITLTRMSEQSEEIPIRVRIEEGEQSSPNRVLSLPLVSPSGEKVSLGSVAEWSIGKKPSYLFRRNSSPCNLISAAVAAGALPVAVENKFRQSLQSEGFHLPRGYRSDFGGISQERNAAVGDLLAYVAIASTLMLTMLVWTFGSFRQAAIIGFVGILSIGLGLLSLWLFQYPIGIVAIIGLVGMMGLAINDSIVVMTDCRTDASFGTSLAQSVKGSTRHVLTTSVTTVAGVLPLYLAGGDFWPPMMIVIAGGVVGATLLALGFTPSTLKLIGIADTGQRRGNNLPLENLPEA